MITEIQSQIKRALLKVVMHSEKPDIIRIEIDAGGSDLPNEGIIVPFLNIYGEKVLPKRNMDKAITKAIKNDEFGYIMDVLDGIVWDDFNIKLTTVFPEWPHNLENGNAAIVDSIKSIIAENSESFIHVSKLYFSYVDHFDWVKIINHPA